MELDIIEALFAAYDRKAKRYTGQETDTTVAEVVGNGCLPGWVAKVRSEKFGPAGNEEAARLRQDIADLEASFKKQLAALSNRLDALYKLEDKRVK